MSELAGYIERMRECLQNGDIEVAHFDADAILCAALERVGGDDAKELVKLYTEVDKWYA